MEERVKWKDWKDRLEMVVERQTEERLDDVVDEDGMAVAREYWKEGSSQEEFLRDYLAENRTEESVALDDGFDPRWEL